MPTWVLDNSVGTDYPGVKRNTLWHVLTYSGAELPEVLQDFTAPRHSWERFVQDAINNAPPPAGTDREALPLRHYQAEQDQRIRRAHADKAPGYVLNYPTGAGKTPISIHALDHISDARKILVIAKPAMIPAWRASIDRFGSGHQQWVVINPEQLWRVFGHPQMRTATIPGPQRAQVMAELGVSREEWDAVVVDESHILAQPGSLRARLVRRLVRSFTLYLSATPFTEPLETAYVAELLAYAAGVAPPADVENDFGEWLRDALSVQLRHSGWNPGDNTVGGVARFTTLLYDRGVGAQAAPADLGLPEQIRELRPIELTPEDRLVYEQKWLEFCDARGLSTFNQTEPEIGMIQALRNLQKASLLKLPAAAEMIADHVADGVQVVVPMFFLESVDTLAELAEQALRRRGLSARVVTITGADSGKFHTRHREVDQRERKRRAFQVGAAQVAIFNAHEGINLHAGERDIDGHGRPGNDVPRITIVADILTGGKRVLQSEGRAQRDGQQAKVIYVYAEDTAEQEWLAGVFAKAAKTQAFSRHPRDADNLLELSAQLRFPVADLPSDGLPGSTSVSADAS